MTSAFSPCPRCGHDLEAMADARACKACHGVWVSEEAIARRLRLRCRTDPGPLVFAEGPGPALPCPVCWDPMAPRSLEGVPVDRCGRHGVWFDVDELERAMASIQARVPPPAPRILSADPPPGPSEAMGTLPGRQRRAPPPPAARRAEREETADTGTAWDVLDVLAEIAHVIARALD